MIRKPIRRRIVAAVTGVVLSAGALGPFATGASASSGWPDADDGIEVEIEATDDSDVVEVEVKLPAPIKFFNGPIQALRGVVRW